MKAESINDNDDTWDDEAIRTCAQCGGNDGYLYSTKMPGRWICKSCHDDHELETYRDRMRGER